MTSSPLVSVIVPVYNVAKLLERCVDSILAQTYTNLEIILIDDGSTDMGGAFCDVYAKRDSRIRVIHQENAGLSAARNAGLKIAKGQYVTFVDSDDAVRPNLIEYLLNLCTDYHVKMSICPFTEVLNGQNPAPAPTDFDQITVVDTLDCLIRMLSEQGFSMSAWGKLYSRDLFKDVIFPTGRLYEDVGTTYRLVLKCPRIAISTLPAYLYYINPDSITQQAFSLKKLDLITLTDKMCDDLTIWGKNQGPRTLRSIEDLTKKRRMHARFSILRQMVMINPSKLSKIDRRSFYKARREVVRYLRRHRNYILKNPLASRRDRLAMRSLQAGLPVFRAAWKHYAKAKTASISQQ